MKNKADINFVNEHGNTPLHYACFWGYSEIAEDLVNFGAYVSVANKYGEIPLDKCGGSVAKRLHGSSSFFLVFFFGLVNLPKFVNCNFPKNISELAVESGQDLKRIGFKDQSWLGLKTRSRKRYL